MPESLTPVLATAREAGLHAGRARGNIWRWASEGRLTRHGLGNRVRYDLNEIPPAEVGGVPPIRYPKPKES